MFNALKYTKKLEEVGFTREQAEAHLQIMTEIIETNLATKQDVKDIQTDLRNSIKEIEHKLTQTEYRMTIKLGTIVSIAIGVAVTLVKLI